MRTAPVEELADGHTGCCFTSTVYTPDCYFVEFGHTNTLYYTIKTHVKMRLQNIVYVTAYFADSLKDLWVNIACA